MFILQIEKLEAFGKNQGQMNSENCMFHLGIRLWQSNFQSNFMLMRLMLLQLFKYDFKFNTKEKILGCKIHDVSTSISINFQKSPEDDDDDESDKYTSRNTGSYILVLEM